MATETLFSASPTCAAMAPEAAPCASRSSLAGTVDGTELLARVDGAECFRAAVWDYGDWCQRQPWMTDPYMYGDSYGLDDYYYPNMHTVHCDFSSSASEITAEITSELRGFDHSGTVHGGEF